MNRILNYPGSKWNLADFIISMMPAHTTYLEPFFGSGAIFFNKQPSTIETINDIDGRIVNFFKQCRDRPRELSQLVELTPLSRQEYMDSYEIAKNPLEDARRMMVRSWQAIGGKTSDHTGWRANIDQNGSKIIEWNHLDKRILAVASRLKDAQIENQDAFRLLERYNRPRVLAYVDPPYLMSTRSKRHYAYEFGDADHEALLDQLVNFKGKVIISGYESDMYEDYLSSWWKATKVASVETGGKRTEVVWCNFPIMKPSEQLDLLEDSK